MKPVVRRSFEPFTEGAFTSASAGSALKQACAEAGMDPSGARLLRFGENAIFQLRAAPAVVRVARGEHLMASAEKEVAVAAWLRDEGLPAARTLPHVAQPVLVAGHPVTFWEFIERSSPDPDYGDLGRMLRRLHALTPPQEVALPVHDVFARTGQRIRTADGIDEDVRRFLLDREEDLRQRLTGVTFESPPSALHGDAHVDNLMRTASGQVVLIDFEGFALGHREWDLVVTGQEYESAGWIDDRQYGEFVGAYGFDVIGWDGYAVLRDVQEFKMTTWLMQNIGEGPQVAEEFGRRLASIRDEATRRAWRPF